jgi:hypothetical protein
VCSRNFKWNSVAGNQKIEKEQRMISKYEEEVQGVKVHCKDLLFTLSNDINSMTIIYLEILWERWQ